MAASLLPPLACPRLHSLHLNLFFHPSPFHSSFDVTMPGLRYFIGAFIIYCVIHSSLVYFILYFPWHVFMTFSLCYRLSPVVYMHLCASRTPQNRPCLFACSHSPGSCAVQCPCPVSCSPAQVFSPRSSIKPSDHRPHASALRHSTSRSSVHSVPH